MTRPSGGPVPGIAPAAKQAGRHAATIIDARVRGEREPGPFRYHHDGDLATVGRSVAVVRLNAVTLTGWLGWVLLGPGAHLLPDRPAQPAGRGAWTGRGAGSPASAMCG